MNIYTLRLLPVILTFLFSGCAGTGGLGSISKTNNLEPGLSTTEVKRVLGEPSQTQFIGNKLIWKYSLHQPWKGWVPYYLAFGKETKKLEGWYASEEEYMRNQQLWLQAFPPTQNMNIQ